MLKFKIFVSLRDQITIIHQLWPMFLLLIREESFIFLQIDFDETSLLPVLWPITDSYNLKS